MMRLLASALWMLMALPPAAQQFGVDVGIVQNCLHATPVGETAPRCLGQAANVCQQQPGADNSYGITQCIQAESTQWDVLLNVEYKATRAAFRAQDASFADALLQAQRAWIAYRDAECGMRYTIYHDGTLRGIVHANCVMVMTAQRTVELRDMRLGR